VKEVFLLYKYGFFHGINPKTGKRTDPLRGSLISAVVMAAVMYYPLSNVMKATSGLEIASLPGNLFVALVYSFSMSILAIVGNLMSSLEVLSEISGMEILLSLPIGKGNILLYLSILNALSGIWIASMIGVVSVAYAISSGLNPALYISLSILHYVFLTSVGGFLGAIISRALKGRVSKKLATLTLTVILLLVMMLVNTGYGESAAEVFKRLEWTSSILSHPLNVFSTPVHPSSIRIVLEVISMAIFYHFFLKMAFSIEGASVGGRKRRAAFGRVGSVLKDVKVAFRSERGFLMLLYPYIFGAIIGMNSDAGMMMAYVLFLIPMYSSSIVSEMMKGDLESWDYLRSLPLKLEEILRSKIYAIFVLGSSLSIIYFIGVTIWKGFDWKAFYVLLYSFLMHASSAPYGISSAMSGGERWKGFLETLPLSLPAFGVVFGMSGMEKWWGLPLLMVSLIVPPVAAVFKYRSVQRTLAIQSAGSFERSSI